MTAMELVHQLTGQGKVDREVKVRVLTRDFDGKVVGMKAARIRTVSGTGDIIVDADDFTEEKL